MSKDLENIIEQAKSEAEIDKIISFFKKNAKIIIGTISAILILSAVLIISGQINKNRKVEYSAKLHQAFIVLEDDDVKSAREILKEIYLSNKSPYSIKSLALLKDASILLEQGQKQSAADIYDSLNKCKKCDSYIRDLAGFLYLDLAVSDKTLVKDEQDLIKRFDQALKDVKNYKYNIIEQRAIFYLQNNQLEKSYQDYDMIAGSPEAPKYLKDRAYNQKINIISKGYKPSQSNDA